MKRKVDVTEMDFYDESSNNNDADYVGTSRAKRTKINVMGPASETGLACGVSQTTQVLALQYYVSSIYFFQYFRSF